MTHFPEERLPITLLRAQRFVTWFVPRIATTLIRRPQAFGLLLRELRGSLAGPALYRLAHAQAVALGDAFPVPARRPAQSQPASVESDLTVSHELDLADASAPLVGLGGAARVRVHVSERGRFLGEVPMEVHEGSVGVDRLRDAIATEFLVDLLGVDWQTARRDSFAVLKDKLKNL
jgi:hypothetical protein